MTARRHKQIVKISGAIPLLGQGGELYPSRTDSDFLARCEP